MKSIVVSADEVAATDIEVASGTSMQVLIGQDTAPGFAMRRFTIKAGGAMPNHTNTVEHEQYVLSGSAEVGIGETVHRLQKDDVVFIPAGVPHWYRVTGDDDYVFLCLVPHRKDTIQLIENT